jgi:hypothetical protein
VPATQAAQLGAAMLDAAKPAGQSVQLAASLAPITGENLPAGQLVQLASDAAPPYVPAPHRVHVITGPVE